MKSTNKLSTTSKEFQEDCLRGAMWEEQYRGRLEEHPSPDLLAVTASRLAKTLQGFLEREEEVASPTRKVAPWELPHQIGLGTYGWRYNPAIIEKAIEMGVALIDTAESYGYGKVEKELGRVLKRYPTQLPWIASKVARNHLSRNACVNAGLRSRDALQIEVIDLYQIHWPVVNRLEHTLYAMAELLERKVIRRVGVSNFCASHLVLAQSLASQRGFRIESNQVRLSCDDPSALDYLVPFCVRKGVRILAYSPLAKGKLGEEARSALRWVVSQPGQPIAVPATNNLGHLEVNLGVKR